MTCAYHFAYDIVPYEPKIMLLNKEDSACYLEQRH